MDFIFITFGLSTLFLFMHKIQWLFAPKPFIINLIYDLILFILSVIMLNNDIGNPKLVVALKMPLLSSLIFFALYQIFKRVYKRDPENTAWSATKKPIQDVVFSILFLLLGVGGPFFIFKF